MLLSFASIDSVEDINSMRIWPYKLVDTLIWDALIKKSFRDKLLYWDIWKYYLCEYIPWSIEAIIKMSAIKNIKQILITWNSNKNIKSYINKWPLKKVFKSIISTADNWTNKFEEVEKLIKEWKINSSNIVVLWDDYVEIDLWARLFEKYWTTIETIMYTWWYTSQKLLSKYNKKKNFINNISYLSNRDEILNKIISYL